MQIHDAWQMVGLTAVPVALMSGSNWSDWPRRFATVLRRAFGRGDVPPHLDDTHYAAEVPPTASGEHSLVDQMLIDSRYALLLRRQLVDNLTLDQYVCSRAALEDSMCIVPEGEVVVHRNPAVEDRDREANADRGFRISVAAYYLDRYTVTNEQFYRFVSGGGYETMSVWAREVLPALLDFVDETGQPGPRHWRNGCYPRGEGKHPVVGVSWYEAAAYARWVGKRLPTDAEWIKAASWPVALAGHPLLQRRYPWGEAIDRGRANLWGSGPGRTVRVDEFSAGVSVGGVQQLIGNVWEWTSDDFSLDAEISAHESSTASLKSLRGGSFETYLDCQATCNFQSGDMALARRHNVGFRCAISLCDLAPPPAAEQEHEEETPDVDNDREDNADNSVEASS